MTANRGLDAFTLSKSGRMVNASYKRLGFGHGGDHSPRKQVAEHQPLSSNTNCLHLLPGASQRLWDGHCEKQDAGQEGMNYSFSHSYVLAGKSIPQQNTNPCEEDVKKS